MLRKEKKVVKANNTMVISRDSITFSHTKDGKVIPMRCRNNGQDYFVMRKEGKEVRPFEVPDSCEFFDPGEYGNVLGMPAHKKLFERRQSLLKQLGPWALVAAIGIFCIMWIVASG